jgi:hypothetical protein
VVDQGEGVAASQFVHWPVLQGDALDLDAGDAGDPMLVGRVGPLGSRVALDPSGEVLAEGVGGGRDLVGLVDRPLGFAFPDNVPLPRFQLGLATLRLPSLPVYLATQTTSPDGLRRLVGDSRLMPSRLGGERGSPPRRWDRSAARLRACSWATHRA